MAPQNPFDTLLDDEQAPASTNPFDRILQQPETDQEVRMRVARKAAQDTTPDKRAAALKLATEVGLPVDVVERNFDTISRRRAVEGQPYTKVQQEAPALAEWSTNPQNAAVSHDDMENLGFLEWVLKAPSRAFAQQINRGRYAELRVKSLFGSLTREEQDQLGSYKFHAEQGGELGVGDSFFAKAVTGAGRLLAQSIEPAKYGIVGGLEGLAIGGAAGSVLPGVGTIGGALAVGQYTARAGLMYGVFKSAATQEAAAAYDDILTMKDETGRTIDPEIARIAALTVGGLNGLVEQVGLEAFLKRFPGLDKLSKGMGRDAMKAALKNPTVRAGFARLAKTYAGGLSVEVATEVAQRAISIAGEELSKAASDTTLAQRTPVQVWDDLVLEAAAAVPEFAIGMLPGPVLSLARDAGRAKQAEQGVQFFTALGEGVTQSKLAQRMPAALQTLVADATKDGPVESVYAPADTWRTYWQQQGIDPAKIAAEVTGRPDALDSADRTGGNLRIPTAAYAARLAGSEHAVFFVNELRLGTPDAMNGREMDEFRVQIDAARERVQEAAKQETPEAQALRGFAEDIEAQLIETGVPRGTSGVMAEALAGVGELASRAGFDPTEVFAAYGLQVRRSLASAAPAVAGGTTIEQGREGAPPEDVPGLAALEASVGGATLDVVDEATGLTLNASGESAASQEALNRQVGMQGRGEQFVVYDRAGRRKPLLGPDAVDYKPHRGETYGVESPAGFRVLDDQGGRPPSRESIESRLGQDIGRILGQRPILPAVPSGQRVEGEPGEPNAAGERAFFAGYQSGFGTMPTMALYTIQGGPSDGSTVDAETLNTMGIPIPATPPLLEFNQRAIANTPALRAWFGHSAVVDEEGQPLVVYHGTTQVFTSFTRERANTESDFGAGFYFSNNPDDVGENYAGVGPDLTAKIERRAEMLAQELEREYDDPEIKQQARAEFVAQEGMTIPVFLKIENPAVLGGPNETRFTLEYEYEPLSTFQAADIEDLRERGMEDEEIRRELADRNRYDPEEHGTLVDFIQALRDVATGYDGGDVGDVIGKLAEAGLDGDLPFSKLLDIYRKDEQVNYFTDDTGNLVGFEILRQALEGAGFDGIIDNTVDVKFGSQRRIGKAMAGMNEDTVHYIVFQPTQIKSALFNRGTFDPMDPNILFQSARDPAPAAQAFYSRLDLAVQESKLAKATGGQWKATIRNARVGVNKDEFAITRVEDLDDKTIYTKDELLAYFKQNRPKVNVVVLEGAAEIDEDALNERATEIFDRMAEEAEGEVDWKDYIGRADTFEDEVEEEVEQLDENGDPKLDEDGDPIVETEFVTRYYPAIRGGYRPRRPRAGQRQAYGVEERDETEILYDEGPFDDESDAEAAAQRYIDNIDREPFYEIVSEGVRENLDYGDAEREAREELEREPDHQTGGRYAEYVLEPDAEEDSYREVFITAGDVAKPAPPARTADEIALEKYGKRFEELEHKAEQSAVSQQLIDEKREAQAGAYRWHDGHDLYKDIDNPIVRIRLNVRETVGEGLPGIPARGERVLFLEEVQPPSQGNETKMAPIFLKHWREIAFKWALREAAIEGLHAVVWTTGDQQADRYSLRRKVHKVNSVNILEDSPAWEAGARKVIHVDLKDQPMLVMQVAEDGVVFQVLSDFSHRWDQLIGQPLGGVLGEELAAQLMASETTVEGKGLLIGGEGLKRLYDYDFRNVVNALPAVKKYGGKVGSVRIPVEQQYEIEEDDFTDERVRELRARGQWPPADAVKVTLKGAAVYTTSTRQEAFDWIQKNKVQPNEQPALIMTPELITAVMGGQALFQAARYRPTTASEIETLNHQVDAVIEKALETAPAGSTLHAYVTSAGELYVADIEVPGVERNIGAGTRMMQALADFADEHNMQMSLIQDDTGKTAARRRFFRRLGFVRNGTGRFYDAASIGTWVRPAKSDTPAARRAMQRGEGKPPRGMVQFAPNRQTTITLFETADLSTFLHETGHFYFELMGDLVDRLDVLDATTLTPQQAQLRADYATILSHLGVTSRGEIEATQHEQFARMFETYLMEGRAPSERLREAFSRFRAWLLGVYRSLKALNAPLTDDVRKVFDRMLASDAAIAEAEASGHMAPMFLTPEAAGMSHERFALYRAGIEEASTAARERLEQQMLAEVQREHTARWKARKAEVKAAVEAETFAMPVYKAIAAMARGTSPEGVPLGEYDAVRATLIGEDLDARAPLLRALFPEYTSAPGPDASDYHQNVYGELTQPARFGTARLFFNDLNARIRAARAAGRMPKVEAVAEPLRLSRAMIVAQFGEERLKGLPKRSYSRDGGVDSNFVADLFGFSSGDELLSAVATAAPMQQRITQETEKRMLLEHGSLLLDGTLIEKAQAAFADETREAVLREELRALARLQAKTRQIEEFGRQQERDERAYERRWFEAEARLRIAIAEGRQQIEIDRLQTEVNRLKATARTGPAKIRGAIPSTRILNDQARTLIAGTKVRDLNPAAYWAAARRASQAATAAAARQDFDAAILAKHQELISLALYRETVKAKTDIDERVKVAQATGRPTSMAKLRIAGETYHDQVAGVLDRFEFANVPQTALDRRAALWKWVQGQEAQGIPVDLPDELLDEARRVNYKELTVEELVGVTDGLKQLVHLARFKGRLLKSATRRQLKAVAQKIGLSIREHKSERQRTVRDRRAGTERKRLVQGVLAAHRKMASLVREMDGFLDGGPLWQAIVRPLNDAGAKEAEMNAAATRRFAELIETAYPRAQKRQLYVKAFVPAVQQSLSKMERLMIALNYGNDGNRDRIKRAEGWTDDQVQAILDTLDARDATFVQGAFTFIGSYWPEIAAKQERVTGVRPEKVDASSFRIGGTTLAGGYFPLKYDDRLSGKAAAQLDLEAANLAKLAAFAHATTKRGHVQARQETLDLPVRLDFGVMFEHVAQVIHDLTHHEALIDVGRVLGHPEVYKAIYETHGDIAYKTIKNTVRDIAFGDLPAVNAFEKALNHTRTGATVVGLGWSLTTAALQPLGFANSVVRIGPAAVARGIGKLIGSPARMNATLEWVYEQSAFMKTRGLTQQRELNEIRNKVGVYSGQFSGWLDEAISKSTFDIVTRQGIADSYFYFIQQMQRIVDVPTWLGAYDRAIREGHDESTSVALADQAVIDSQGGGQIKDLASVQRGHPAAKLFTNFYSYFSVVYNQAVESGKRVAMQRDVASVGRLAVDYLMLFIVPATLGYFIRELMRPGDDDKGLAEALIVENLSYLFGMMVGLREFTGAVQGYYGYEGPAGARIFSAGSKAIRQVRQGELDEAAMRSANEFLGLLFHYPASQVWRTTSGIAAIAEGKTENPMALVTGPEPK